MHIGFDAKRLFFNNTGLGNYSRTLVKNLHQAFPELTYHLYAPKLTDTIQTKHPYFQQANFVFHSNQQIPGSLWRSWQMTSHWKKHSLAIYHGLSNELPFKKEATTRTIVTIHDLIFKRLPATYSSADRLIYDKKVRWSCERADKIIAISEHTKKDLIDYYQIAPQKIEVIYQAVGDLFYQDTPKTFLTKNLDLPTDYLLSVGSLQTRKNQLRILEAWRLLPADLQIPLVFVGRGAQYQQQLASYAQQHSIPVYFLTTIDQVSTLKKIYQNARLLLYPSLYEGFGLPVVEAQLCKVPVITSTVSALPEAASAATILVDPYEVPAISTAIERVLTDTVLRQQMIKEGHLYATKQFDPLSLSQQLMEVYHLLLKSC